MHDIAPDRIGAYVATLTPVVLLHDTAVTNYGFHGGIATPRQSVPQAGDLQGTRWDGFDPAAALTVTAGPPTPTFTLVDIATGQT